VTFRPATLSSYDAIFLFLCLYIGRTADSPVAVAALAARRCRNVSTYRGFDAGNPVGNECFLTTERGNHAAPARPGTNSLFIGNKATTH